MSFILHSTISYYSIMSFLIVLFEDMEPDGIVYLWLISQAWHVSEWNPRCGQGVVSGRRDFGPVPWFYAGDAESVSSQCCEMAFVSYVVVPTTVMILEYFTLFFNKKLYVFVAVDS